MTAAETSLRAWNRPAPTGTTGASCRTSPVSLAYSYVVCSHSFLLPSVDVADPTQTCHWLKGETETTIEEKTSSKIILMHLLNYICNVESHITPSTKILFPKKKKE